MRAKAVIPLRARAGCRSARKAPAPWAERPEALAEVAQRDRGLDGCGALLRENLRRGLPGLLRHEDGRYKVAAVEARIEIRDRDFLRCR